MILNFLRGYNVNGSRKKTDFENKIKNGSKLHTLRADPKNRWKDGNKIHFSTGARSSHYNCFKEGVCISTQGIEIRDRKIWIDGALLTGDEKLFLAENDGFDSIQEFWDWFDQYSPFYGKIIHWTNLKY